MFHFGDMSLKQIRIARLKQFQSEKRADGPVELGRLIGKSTQQTSDLLSGRAPFGEKVAHSIEDAAGLPQGWLDGKGAGWPFPDIDERRFLALSVMQRGEIQGEVLKLIEKIEARRSGKSTGSQDDAGHQEAA